MPHLPWKVRHVRCAPWPWCAPTPHAPSCTTPAPTLHPRRRPAAPLLIRVHTTLHPPRAHPAPTCPHDDDQVPRRHSQAGVHQQGRSVLPPGEAGLPQLHRGLEGGGGRQRRRRLHLRGLHVCSSSRGGGGVGGRGGGGKSKAPAAAAPSPGPTCLRQQPEWEWVGWGTRNPIPRQQKRRLRLRGLHAAGMGTESTRPQISGGVVPTTGHYQPRVRKRKRRSV